MATITLSGTSLNYGMGINAFGGLGSAFSNAKKTANGLHEALGSLRSKINTASPAGDVSTSETQAQKAQTRESEKNGSLSVAYDKLDTLISDVGDVDNKASEKIGEREDDFYKEYSYLKPECKKSWKEKFKEWCSDVVEWCKENWVAIVTAIAVVVVAVLLVVLTPLTAAFIACVAGIIGLVLLVADLVVAFCNDGKGIAELLKENGHPILAQMFTGFQWGCDLVQIVLPLGAAVKAIGKVGFKTFVKASWVATKKTAKESFEAVFRSGFKDGVKNAFKIAAKSLLFDWDDLKLYNKNMLDLTTAPLRGMEKDFTVGADELIPNSQKARDALEKYGLSSLKILENGDIDWGEMAIKSVDMDMGKIDLSLENIDNYLNGRSLSGVNGKTTEEQMSNFLRKNTYGQAFDNLKLDLGVDTKAAAEKGLQSLGKETFGLDSLPKVTPHDFFSTKQMIFVPTEIHSLVKHNGAIAVYKDSLKMIDFSFSSALKNIPWGRWAVGAAADN